MSTAAEAPAAAGPGWADRLRGMGSRALRSPGWMLLAVLLVVFSLGSPYFLTAGNIANVLSQSVLVGLVAIGLTPLVISGQIDLSVGAVAAFCACLLVPLHAVLGVWPAIVATILAGGLLGLFNGLVVERLGLNAFIVTIAMATGIRGIAFLVFGERTALAADGSLLALGAARLGPVPGDVILFALAALGLAALMRFSVHGVHSYAIGGNRQAASDAGVRVSRHVIANFVIAGAFAGLVGVVLVTKLGAASATYAAGYELWAVIAVILGGARLAGGRGAVIGTVVAALALAVLRNGMNLVQIPTNTIPIAIGVALIGALVFDRLSAGEPEHAE